MSEAIVLYDVNDKVALITLNRPQTINAFNPALSNALNEALRRFAADEGAWAAIICGAGAKGFSSGADLKSLEVDESTGQHKPLPSLIICDGMVTPKPIAAAVHGYCLGEGVYLALACDIIFAAANSQFYVPEARVGVNAVDIPLQLARKIGYNHAFELLMGLAPKSAGWCQRAGLVNEVVEGDVVAAARAWAAQLVAETAPLAIQGMKETLWRAVQEGEAAGAAAGGRWRQRILDSQDWQEGLAAFRAKRKPQYRGM